MVNPKGNLQLGDGLYPLSNQFEFKLGGYGSLIGGFNTLCYVDLHG